MKTNKNIQNSVDNALKAINTIEDVNVSPFFKDKTLQLLFAEKETTTTTTTTTSIWSWFTPQLQLATLACVLLINVYAIQQLKSAKYDEEISSFASDYGIVSESSSSIFNF